MKKNTCLGFTQRERMFRTSVMSASKRGSVWRKLHHPIICLKIPPAQLTHLLKPTAFGLFTEILEVSWRNAPTEEFCICCCVCLAPGSRACPCQTDGYHRHHHGQNLLPQTVGKHTFPLKEWKNILSTHFPCPSTTHGILRPDGHLMLHLPCFWSSAPTGHDRRAWAWPWTRHV